MRKIAGQFSAEIINYPVCVRNMLDVYVMQMVEFIGNKHERNFHFSTISGGQCVLDQLKSESAYCIMEFCAFFKVYKWNV